MTALLFMGKQSYTLQLFGLPVIRNINDLSDHIHLSPAILYRLSKFNRNFYKVFQIPKKHQGYRTIYCPSTQMKAVQAWILRNILEKISISDNAMAFRRNSNIAINAQRHSSSKYFYCLDLEDFFPSITYAKVFHIFRTIGYEKFMAHVLTSLCTCDGKLPQGAVTSPALSNIVCISLDNRMEAHAGRLDVVYTRYADDMCFSSYTLRRLVKIAKPAQKIIETADFSINANKTRLSGPSCQRKVTGLIHDGKHFGIGKTKYRLLRAQLHKICTESMPELEHTKAENILCGWCAFLSDADPERLKKLKKHFLALNAKFKPNLPNLSRKFAI